MNKICNEAKNKIKKEKLKEQDKFEKWQCIFEHRLCPTCGQKLHEKKKYKKIIKQIFTGDPYILICSKHGKVGNGPFVRAV